MHLYSERVPNEPSARKLQHSDAVVCAAAIMVVATLSAVRVAKSIRGRTIYVSKRL